jgi:parallel beta-helix repeat protein
MRVAAALAILVVVLAGQAMATVYRVSAENKDLEDVLRKAKYGDSVLVYPGRYNVQSRVKPGVKLLAVAGPDSTVLWNQRWHALKLNDCDMETLVEGFTFECKGCNIAIACTLGAPTIVGNVIKGAWDGISLQSSNAFVKGNTVEGCNRGIVAASCNPELVENTVMKNGEGIYLYSSSAILARCKIQSNGKGIFMQGYCYPTIGGMLSTANDIIDNGYPLYNDGRRISGSLYTDEREVAVATHNYWGSLCPDKSKFRGIVVYYPWANAMHDSAYMDCPPDSAPKAGAPTESGLKD